MQINNQPTYPKVKGHTPSVTIYILLSSQNKRLFLGKSRELRNLIVILNALTISIIFTSLPFMREN
jgi:hypothetical protein